MPTNEAWDEQEKAIREQFEQLVPELEQWGNAVDGYIMQALRDANFPEDDIKIAPVHRVKSITSFISKALYREKSSKYRNHITDIEDKVATRIVLLTTKQLSEVQDILCSAPYWQARLDKNISNDIELSPSTFGYQAAHIIVTPLYTVSSSENGLLNPIACEIQLKTLFQHAYSEMSHSTVYKGPYRQDTELLRRLARSMALMEAVDDYFQDMYSLIESGRSLPAALSKEMTMRFGQLWPDFDKNSVDANLSISIFNNLYEEGVLTVQALDEFVTRNTPSLQRIIYRNKYYLSHQPVLIFVAFLMKNRKRFLERKWDFDTGILDEIASELGISREEYEG